MTPARSVFRSIHRRLTGLAIAASLATGSVAAAATPPLFPALSPGLSLLERHYLFDSELEPPRLFDEAGKVYSRDIDDLSIRRVSDRVWLYRTPDCDLRIEVPADATVRSLEAPLTSVGRFLEACSTELPPKMPEMDSYLLGGVLAGLDPYSVVFDRKHQTEHNIQYQGRLAGIGARIGLRKNQLTLIEVYPDSPAARADLRDDDAILRIDNLSTKNILPTDAVERIRGKEGTTVTLLIRREGETEPRSVVVTRGIVMIPSVKSRILNADILYTEITQFSQTTPDDFRHHLKKAMDDKNLRGVIIDLRRNSGGSMMGSSAIGDLFLREGLLITTAGRDGQPARGLTPEVLASGEAMAPDLPVVFLTSPGTASGSELLAASLRNNDRALILGEHTFGKGCIQKTFPLHESSTMKMTVGHFLPNALPIPGGGLVPDVEVLTWRVGHGHLDVPLPIRETDTPFWLRTPRWSKVEAAPSAWRIEFAEAFPDDDPSLIEDPEEQMAARLELEEERFDPEHPDRLIEIAAAVLRNHGSSSAKQMLADAGDFLQRTVETSQADLVEFMYENGLDWTDGPRPQVSPRLTLQVIPVSPLRAGEETEVEIRITNQSAAPFYRLRGILDSTSGAFNNRPVAFGRIEPGATRSWRMKTKTPGTARTGRVSVAALLFDDEGELVKVAPVRLAILEGERPHLAVQARVTAGSDPSRIDIALDIENRGAGPAEKVVVRLKHPEDEKFEILEGAADADELAPGAKASFVLKTRLLGSYQTAPEALVQVTEARHGLFLERKTPLSAASAADATVDAAGGSAPAAADPELETESWNEPPRIRIEGFDPGEDGEYEVRISATDDHRLAQVRVRVDDETVAYVEPTDGDGRSAELTIPWKAGEDVRKLRIEAVDGDGMREIYAGSL